jgi:hypothetical protein
MDVKMSHDEDRKWSEIRFSLSGEEREMDGVAWSLIFGAGQKPAVRAEALLNHIKALAEKEQQKKATPQAAGPA